MNYSKYTLCPSCPFLLLVLIFFSSFLQAQNLPVVWLDDDWPGPWRGTEAEPCSSLQQLFRAGPNQTPIVENYTQTGIIIILKPGIYNSTNFNLANDFFQSGFNATHKTFIFRATTHFNQNPNTTGRNPNSSSEVRITDMGAIPTQTGLSNTFIFEGFTFEGTSFRLPSGGFHKVILRNNIFTGNITSIAQFTSIATLELTQNRIIGATFSNTALLEAAEINHVHIQANEFLGVNTTLPNILILKDCRNIVFQRNSFLNFNPVANNSIIEIVGGNNTLSATLQENSFTNSITNFFNAYGCIYLENTPQIVIERNRVNNISVATIPPLPTLTQRPFFFAVNSSNNTTSRATVIDNIVTNSNCNGGIIRLEGIFFSEIKSNLIALTNNANNSSALIQILGGNKTIIQSNTFQNILAAGNLNAACIRIGAQFPAAQPNAADSSIVQNNVITQIGSITETGNANGIIIWGGKFHLIENNTLSSSYGISGITIIARGLSSGVNTYIRNNSLIRVRGNRILLLGQVSGILENNTIYDYDP
ncbi:MAG: hypothetical protein RML72_07315, partial [Bacteroidia bacterium]|nr:hypothetical protein [Bacteroidia bacterium]MDW8158669.1 hypothetical protein [Bacteroidia bacterium]